MSQLPSGSVTFLFTDIEGSTRLWEQFPDAMRTVLARHDALIATVVNEHSGIVFKTSGDAVHAVFAGAPDALRAAIAAQRQLHDELWEIDQPLAVRMALHTGSADPHDGDYHGPPLNRVARLLATAHGGQIVLSSSTHALVIDTLPDGVTLLDLGSHQLQDLSRPEHIWQAQVAGLRVDFPPLRARSARAHDLPQPATSLIGREREVTAIIERVTLSRSRLVTLTGPGGTGKTRLAIEVAQRVAPAMADGVVFVPLALVPDADMVPSAIASALGIKESGAQSLERSIQSSIGDRELFLVLDNMEQVINAAPLIARLLASCPALRVLATSRMALRISGEQVVAIPPLRLPNLSALPPLAELGAYESITLFTQRARAVDAAFELTAVNAPAVAAICQQLDGLPLAIELAAARIRLLPPQAMLGRLDQRLRLLTTGGRDRPERQQTLRNLIAWSYDLLSDTEQQHFRRLGVFAGGWALDAAEAVIGPDVLDSLSTLIDHSLINQAEQPDGSARFSMLETIREYALEKLAEHGEEAAARERHVDWCLVLAEEMETRFDEHRQASDLDQVTREQDNLRAAMEWLLQLGDGQRGLQLTGYLGFFWFDRGPYTEGVGWIEAFASLPSGQQRTRARALALGGLGWLLMQTRSYQRATAVLDESLGIFDEIGDQRLVPWFLIARGSVARSIHNLDEADHYFRQALAVARATDDQLYIPTALTNACSVAHMRGDLDAAVALGQEALELARRSRRPSQECYALGTLGSAITDQGDLDTAQALITRSLEIAREHSFAWGIHNALRASAYNAHVRGDVTREFRDLAELASASRDAGDPLGMGVALVEMGRVEIERGNRSAAATHLYHALSGLRDVPSLSECLALVATIASQSGLSGHAARLMGAAAALHDAREEPAHASPDEGYSRYVTASLPLGDEVAWERDRARGHAMSQEQAVAEALDVLAPLIQV